MELRTAMKVVENYLTTNLDADPEFRAALFRALDCMTKIAARRKKVVYAG